MFNKVLTDLFKGIILSEGLVRTGALYGSVDVDTYLDSDGTMTININCKDYAKYLNDNYGLIRQFEDSPVFTEEVSSLFAPWLESRVVEIINGSPVMYEDPRVVILLNGS